MTAAADPVAPDVWRITTPLPGRPREVHAYLCRLAGGDHLLVDGGIDGDEAWAALDRGVRAVCAWDGVALHVVTHMHLDHVGLCARVRDRCGARLAMGALDAERAAHAAADPADEEAYRAGLLRRGGAPPELLAAAGGAGRGLGGFVAPQLALSGGGGPLDGAGDWHWLPTPGHTAGHISLWRAADGIVIGGDAVLERVTPTIGVNRQRDDPVGDYLGSLARLQALPAATLLPGHGRPLAPPHGRIRELVAETGAEGARLLDALGGGEATAWELAGRRYTGRELPAALLVHALRETLAHLEHLRRLGRVGAAADDAGALRFRRAGRDVVA